MLHPPFLLTQRSSRRALADLVWISVLTALPFLLYRAALDLWWSEDDFFQVPYTLGHSPAEYLLDPHVWRLLPNHRVLYPLMFLSYDVDLRLFGLDAAAFYAHQLLAIGLAAAASYFVLRLWLRASWAGIGALIFLLGPPVASLASHLMVRHYPETIALASAAAGCWVLSVREDRRAGALTLSIVSAFLFLVATLGKEIAVPLPFLLALLPERTWSRRLRLLVPHVVAIVLYAGYRVWMLGTPLGGYGFATTPAQWPRLALQLPQKIAVELTGGSGWGWAALCLLLAPAVLLVSRSRRAATLLAAGFVLAVLPVLPVSVEVSPRYAVTAWLVIAAALPFGLRAVAEGVDLEAARAHRHLLAPVLVTVAVGSALAANRAAWAGPNGYLAHAERMRAEYQSVLEMDSGEILIRPVAPPASMYELRPFAEHVLQRQAEGGWLYDELPLCSSESSGTVYAYDPTARRVAELAETAPSIRSYCDSIRWDAPLVAELRAESDGIVAWELGPYEDGQYAFVLDGGRSRFDLPREAAFRLQGPRRLVLRVRYDSGAGWITYSPELELDLASDTETGRVVRWQR